MIEGAQEKPLGQEHFTREAFTLRLLNSGTFNIKRNQSGYLDNVKDSVDLESLTAFADEEQKLNEKWKESDGSTNIETTDEENYDRAKEALSFTTETLTKAGILNNESQQENGAPIRIELISDCHFRGLYMPDGWEDDDGAKLKLGMEQIKKSAAKAKKKIETCGLPIPDDVVLSLELLLTVSHEYGHHISSNSADFGRQMSSKAELLNPSDVGLAESKLQELSEIKHMVFLERFSQSIAAVVLSKKLEGLNLTEEQIKIVMDALLETNDPVLKEYELLFRWAQDHMITPNEMFGIAQDLSFYMSDKEIYGAKRCVTAVNSLGYYLEPYSEEEVKAISETSK
jgi:hypothetical protein